MLKPILNVLLRSVLMSVLMLLLTLGSEPLNAQPLSTQPSSNQSSGGSSLFSFAGKRPENLGVKDEKLAACPSSPNCVSSQAATTDAEHSIAAFSYQSEPLAAIATLKSVIQSMPRTKLVTEDSNYLYAEFATALMGFVDDVEFYLDDANRVIHVRSASRLGQSDLGVNRKRIEEIRGAFSALDSAK